MKRTHVAKFFVLTLSCLALLAGCSSGDASPDAQSPQVSEEELQIVGSCDVRDALGYCYEYRGAAWTAADAEADCSTAPDGVYSSLTCPGGNHVGACEFQPGDDPERTLIYLT